MKIAFDVSYIQRQGTGYGRFSLELLRSLLEHDHENIYLLHGWSYSLDKTELHACKRNNTEMRIARIPGLVKRTYWNNIRMPNIETLIGEFDIFHGAEPMLPPTKKSTIATVHDLAYKRFPQFFETSVHRWDAYVERSIRQAEAIIVPSENTKKDIVELFRIPAEKIRVIHIHVSKQFSPFQTGSDETVKQRYGLAERYILFVGTLEPRKNIPFLIKGFEKFQKTHNDTQLVIAGKKGWFFNEIFKTIEQSSARKNIRYLNYISENDLSVLYRSALYFVYPSLYEGYGFPVLEAMASGTPVITSRTSSLKELGEGAAILIDPNQPDELLDGMETLFNNAAFRDEFKTKGLERVKNFSRKGAAETVVDIYRSIASK